MTTLLTIIRKAATVYCVTVAAGLALWTCVWLMTRVPRAADGSEYDGPIPAELVQQIEGHLQRGAR